MNTTIKYYATTNSGVTSTATIDVPNLTFAHIKDILGCPDAQSLTFVAKPQELGSYLHSDHEPVLAALV